MLIFIVPVWIAFLLYMAMLVCALGVQDAKNTWRGLTREMSGS
jgi:hypothetical protein